MKLKLHILENGGAIKLTAPDGTEIEGLKSVKLPDLPARHFEASVWLEFDMTNTAIDLFYDFDAIPGSSKS